MLSRSPIKWRQRPDLSIAVDCHVKHKFEQTKLSLFVVHRNHSNIDRRCIYIPLKMRIYLMPDNFNATK